MTAAHQTARGDRSGRGSPTGAPATTHVHPGQTVVTGDQASIRTRTIVVTGARGGQGTTTVAAAIALHAARAGEAVLVAPPEQSAAALLGVPAIQQGDAVEVTEHLMLAAPPTALTAATVVVDGGQHDGLDDRLADDHTEAYVVLRGPCYLALATLLSQSGPRPTGIILVAEEGRSLTARDVSEVTDLPVVATVEATQRVARTIDAGLLPSRISRLHELRQLDTLATAPPRIATVRRPPPNHPVTKPSETHTDLPLSRSDNCGGPSPRGFPCRVRLA